jgi:hypothetical protein
MNNCVLTLQTRLSSAFIGFKVTLCAAVVGNSNNNNSGSDVDRSY